MKYIFTLQTAVGEVKHEQTVFVFNTQKWLHVTLKALWQTLMVFWFWWSFLMTQYEDYISHEHYYPLSQRQSPCQLLDLKQINDTQISLLRQPLLVWDNF